MAHAVYIHIPFCTNKCHYCDFNTYVLKGQPVDQYLDALEREFELTFAKFPSPEIKTIFVGGGTPTALTPPQMERFLAIVNRYVRPLSPNVEFTMEANPGSSDAEKLQVMKEGGVNRLSFGVQTFNPELLKYIGRIHSVDEVYAVLESAKKLGFNNISIDFIFGLPKQTMADMEDSLKRAFQLDLQHFSIYSLKIEENTLFHTLFEKNELPLPHEDTELAMYELIMGEMEKHGYKQYEISNFAKPGFESAHNTTYWRNEDYYGLGAGAHGYMNGYRHINIKGIQPYIEGSRDNQLPRLQTYKINRQESMEDFMMVGLRLLDGVSDDEFKRRYNQSFYDVFKEPIEKNIAHGLLIKEMQNLRLSKKGLLFGNDVFGSFLS